MILQQALKNNGPVPKKIAEAPILRFGLELYYAAFMDLVSIRSGFGDGPIPFSAIADWARIAELDEEQTEDLHYYMSAMDAVYMEHVKKKQPKGKGKGK